MKYLDIARPVQSYLFVNVYNESYNTFSSTKTFLFLYFTEQLSADNKDTIQEENEDGQQVEESEDNEEEPNEMTLLCPTTQDEIIITPSTLTCTSKVDVKNEDIFIKKFKSLSKLC